MFVLTRLVLSCLLCVVCAVDALDCSLFVFIVVFVCGLLIFVVLRGFKRLLVWFVPLFCCLCCVLICC